LSRPEKFGSQPDDTEGESEEEDEETEDVDESEENKEIKVRGLGKWQDRRNWNLVSRSLIQRNRNEWVRAVSVLGVTTDLPFVTPLALTSLDDLFRLSSRIVGKRI